MKAATKFHMALAPHSLAYIDRIRLDAREANGVCISRSAILQALVDSLAKRGINASKIRSEDDLRRLVA